MQYLQLRMLAWLEAAAILCFALITATKSQDAALLFLGQSPSTAYVSRAAPPGHPVYQFVAVNGETGSWDGVSYRLVQGDECLFSINNETGQLNTLKYMPLQVFLVEVEAKLEFQSTKTQLMVHVVPEHITAPRFEHSPFSFNISEYARIGAPFGLVRAFTLEQEGIFQGYSIISGNTGNDLTISNTTGVLFVAKELDRERTSSYTLNVSYMESGAEMLVLVDVSVLDENDNAPQFSQLLYEASISELDPADTSVICVSASDKDFAENQIIEYSIYNEADTFTINLSGELHTTRQLNYEQRTAYTLAVIAKDGGTPAQTSTTIVLVTVINEPDEPPIFDSLFYTVFLNPSDSVMEGMELVTVQAIDPDFLSDVTYALESDSEPEGLQLNSQTGLITLEQTIPNTYFLTVSASDGTQVSVSFAEVVISISSGNTHRPEFQDSNACVAEIEENVPIGTVATTLVAMDGDTGIYSQLTYMFTESNGPFEVDINQGTVSTTGHLDHETESFYSIGVVVRDGGNKQAYCLLNITVLDVNDNAPSFLIPNNTIKIKLTENSGIGTNVTQIVAEDLDSGHNGDIQFVLYDTYSTFAINSTSGMITIISDVNQMTYDLTVEARDGLHHSYITFTVVFENNTQLPVFSQLVYTATVCENQPVFTEILQVHTDISGIAFELIDGNQYHTNAAGVFRIDENGQITVSSQSTLDYEGLPNGQFIFLVTGRILQEGVIGMATIEINVMDQDDNPPIFQSMYVFASISENMPMGTVVTQLVAVDPDSGTNGDISYTVVEGQTMFNVTQSGEIYSLQSFDTEDTPELYIHVVAVNPNPVDGSDPCSSIATRQTENAFIEVTILDVNDNPPSITTEVDNLTLNESTPVGSEFDLFTATDGDSSDSANLGYTIVAGNEGHFFHIDNDGVLRLIQPLNFEVASMYSLDVQVSDGIHIAATSILIIVIDVDNEPPHFEKDLYTATITENVLAENIIQVSVETPSSAVKYWLSGPVGGRLTIDTNGNVTVARSIDREEFPDGIMSVLAVAENGGLSTAYITISIEDVNDCIPQFVDINIEVLQENLEPGPDGVHVGTVQARDLDSGPNGEIMYKLLEGEDYGFRIDSSTGEITTTSTYDREKVPFYNLLVEAVDMGTEQFSSTALLRVWIGDEDDNPSSFPFAYMFSRIFENSNVGTKIVQVPVIDLDEEVNAEYRLTSENPDEMKFTIDSGTGVVRLNELLDYEDLSHHIFNLTITLTGPMVASDQSTALLEIEVLDQNDNTPILTLTNMVSSIFENTPIGRSVLEIEASDIDSGSNAEIVISIISGDPDGDFEISGSELRTAKQLDYETMNKYDIVLQACDMGIPSKCTTDSVSIPIQNVKDVKPAFTESVYMASIDENEDPVNNILQVTAIDSESDGISNFTYKIESGNDSIFKLDATSGVLSSKNMLDHEEQDVYILIITVQDVDDPFPLVGTGSIVITVVDLNDNYPSPTSEWQIQMILLNGHLKTGKFVEVYFSDPDSVNTFSDCSVVEEENSPPITLMASSCRLYLEQGDYSEGTYGLGVTENNLNVDSQVKMNITHISTQEIPLEYLVTVSLAMTAADYLKTSYTAFPNNVSKLLNAKEFAVISVQNGYYNPNNTVDVSFTAKDRGGCYIHPTLILQALFIDRERLKAVGFELSALPTDPCSSEPCFNHANCKSFKNIGLSSLTAQSPNFYLFSPSIQLDFECDCVPGTSGKYCSIDFDDCYSNPCHYGARCVDEVNGFHCDCPAGSSGVDCSEVVDTCSSNPCQNGATCEIIPGFYICHCTPGYHGPNCQHHLFKTASFCSSNPCQKNSTCSSGRDDFTCFCKAGSSGRYCEGETVVQGGCISNPCLHGSTCISELVPVCSCSPGFTGPLCEWPIDNCQLGPCQNGGTCATGLYGSYQCYCVPPYTGTNCTDTISGCDTTCDLLCQNGGRCSNLDNGQYSCECTRGYYGDNCEYAVHPLNLCSNMAPCLSGNCTNGRDSYTCTCTDDHSGNHCEIETSPLHPCDRNPCQHGGTCEMNSQSYTCNCSVGFTGSNCEININDCESEPCVNGVCIDGINGFLCRCNSEQISGYNCEKYCPDRHYGDFCEIVSPLCDSEHPCQNGGTCTVSLDICICPPTHTGPFCEQEITCDAAQTNESGTCSSLNDYGCECKNGSKCGISFTSGNSYRAYNSFPFRGQGYVQFEFNTVDSEGLLLYSTQLQDGESGDYIVAEVFAGQLVVRVSLGNNVTSAVTLSSTTLVNDGQWHSITITIDGKVRKIKVIPTYTIYGC